MELLTTKQVAKILGVTSRRVRQLIESGELAAHKVGRDYYIFLAALDKYQNKFGLERMDRRAASVPRSGDTIEDSDATE